MDNESKHIRDLRNGSYQSFTFLYDRYVGLLYSFIFSMINNRDVAQDIVQETFLKIWAQKENIDTQQSFRNYLFTVARNMLLNELRKKINTTLSIDLFTDSDFTSEEWDNENEWMEERLTKIKMAKQKLPARQLQLFEMNKEQGLSIPEIMKITRLSEAAVRNQIFMAIKTIRKHLNTTAFIFFLRDFL